MDSEEESGLPFSPIEVVNCGIHKELMEDEIKQIMNDQLTNYQFNDLKIKWDTKGVAYNGQLRTTADYGQRPIMHNGRFCPTAVVSYPRY